MAYSISGSSVVMTRGRGAARVELRVSFADLEKWARRMKVDTEKLMKRSFGRACSGLKKKFQQVMSEGGGVLGVPKFRTWEDFTRELRTVEGKAGNPLGGILADKKRIVAFKRNGWQIIGWPDGMAKIAVAWQEGRAADKIGETFLQEPRVRYALHRKGIRFIPYAYVHNPRRMIPEPFGSFVKAHLEEWARGAFYKELARQMQKGAAT